MISGNKQIYFSILAALILLCAAGKVAAQGTIGKQVGEFYNDYTTTDGGQDIQKTNTYRTTVYVKPSTNKSLSIPTTGSAAPHSYVRWYDYNTNGTPNNVTVSGGVKYNNGYAAKYAKSNNSWNLTMLNSIIYNSSNPSGVIACDVSAYTDYVYSQNGNNRYFTQEPTLSYRWIFEIKNAHEIARALKSLGSGKYLEEKTVNLPATKLSGTLSDNDGYPRIPLEYEIENYYGYNHASNTTNNNLKNDGTIKVYGDGKENNGVSRNGRFIRIDQSKKIKEITVTLTCGKQVYRIARFTLNYVEDPINFDNLPKERKLSFFKKNYVELGKLDFDYNTALATPANNCWLQPLEWDYCSYGFASASLYIKGKRDMSDGCAASQNEYGFYKTANVTGLSKKGATYSGINITDPKGKLQNGQYFYKWWNGNEAVHDRRYYDTGGKEAGYFMYIDASDKPGIVAKLRVDGTFCAETKLFVSAAICNMSDGAKNSDADLNFIFKAVDEASGKEYELYRYTSGDIPKYSKGGEEPWYQIFFSFSYEEPAEGVVYDHFLLQVENNASSTQGGDYAIDDIRVYRSKPTVQANQILLPCGTEESAKIKIQIGYDKLLSTLWTSGTSNEIEIKYQFMDEDKKAITGYNYHQGATSAESPFYTCGSIWIKTDKEDMDTWTENESNLDGSFAQLPIATGDKVFAKIEHIENDPQGQYDYIVFRTPNNDVLKYNKIYHTTIANSGGAFETGVCSLISDPFIIEKPGQITVDGAAVIDGKGICYGSPVTMKAVLLDRINHEPIEPCSFDWYFGSEWEAVSAPLSHYRAEEAYPSSVDDTKTSLQPAKGVFTKEDHDILEEAISTHKLYLNRKEIVRRVMKGETVLAKPIEASTGKKNDPNFNICNDVIQLNTSSESAMPEVEIGQGLKTQVVRMDLAQAQDLIGDVNKTMWIPVNDFSSSDGSKAYNIVQSDDNLYDDKNTGIVYLCGTNDPVYKDIDFGEVLLPKIAQLKTINVGPDIEKYLVFSFNAKDDGFTATKGGFQMKEGFTYSLMFFYNEENNGSGEIEYSVCNGMSTLNLCIVPQYLTWTGTEGDNWNNDGNWKRSAKEELYKADTDAYADYAGEEAKLARGFVPMHNSLATITNTKTAPWLYKLNSRENGSLDISGNTNHPAAATDSTDYKANAPTKEIEYELEVWNGKDDAIASNTAKEHTYAGALFRGNSCKQIFFKQGAEMRNTQYLTYDKAHVEFELTNNRWYMLSSPLQDVVAGDMYIPTKGGRQVTEAFTPITYQQGTINNRFDPAVYQRSWSKNIAEVWQKNVGSYKVNRTGDWSGAFNQVDVPYTTGTGFSIRPVYFENNNGSKEIKEGHKTLFRLPKEDASYSYYEYGNNTPDRDMTISRTNNGKLATDHTEGTVQSSLEINTGEILVFLAGNPFMATLDMDKFFEENNQDLQYNDKLKEEYTILTEKGQCTFTKHDGSWVSSIAGFTGGSIAPMQGFFVIKANAGGNFNVTYKTDMTIAKPATGSPLLRSVQTRSEGDGTARLYVTAERDGFQSHILIAKQFGADNGYNEEEDAASIIDSNLKEYPTLYSVADSIVTAINFISDRKMIPLGVYSENNKNVTLTFEGVESFNEEISIYDAQKHTYSPISTRSTLVVPGNTHGRYFLNIGGEEELDRAELNAYSPGASRIVITASVGDPLKEVRIYNTLGMEVRRLAQLNSTQEEITIPGGLYIVRIESETKNATVKVAVKDR